MTTWITDSSWTTELEELAGQLEQVLQGYEQLLATPGVTRTWSQHRTTTKRHLPPSPTARVAN